MVLFTLIPIPFIALVLTLTTGNCISAVSSINPFIKFGIFHPPKTTVVNLDADEYRSILGDLLRRSSETEVNGQIEDDPSDTASFMRYRTEQQNGQRGHGIFGANSKQLSILDAAYVLAGRRNAIVRKRFNRIGGNIMMGKKKK